MIRDRITSAVALLLAGASLCAAPASAATHEAAEEPVVPLGFALTGTHGYSITGSAYLDPISGRETIGITVSRGKETVSYGAPARVTADSIHADLGSLGRVDLVLRGSGHEKTVDVKCLHFHETFEPGTYEGIIEFNGEGGFTRARATQLAGRPALALGANRFCAQHGSGESRGPNEPGARLAGVSYAHGRTLKFQINKNRRDGRTIFSASLSERRGRVRIYRELAGVAPASAFRYDQGLRTATLSPPAPFSGSATLRRRRNSVSPLLTGDLTLAFPGRSVRLAEPNVHVSLVHARLTKGSSAGSASISIGL